MQEILCITLKWSIGNEWNQYYARNAILCQSLWYKILLINEIPWNTMQKILSTKCHQLCKIYYAIFWNEIYLFFKICSIYYQWNESNTMQEMSSNTLKKIW